MWRAPEIANGWRMPVSFPPIGSSFPPTISRGIHIAHTDPGEYGLLSLRWLDAGPVSPDALLSLKTSVSETRNASSEPLASVEPDGPIEDDDISLGQNILRTLLGTSPPRNDLTVDEFGNILAPEVSELIQAIVASTKADEPALRRRIGKMFRGEPRTANWFHQYLSDLLAGDPPEEILRELSYRADERFRLQRQSIAFFSNIAIPAAGAQPGPRPFTHLNDPVPRDPNMERFRGVMRGYEFNQKARALERAKADPAVRPRLEGQHWNVQGTEFEGVARGLDTARGENVGPRLIVERPESWREYDYTLLDRLNNLKYPVEAKSGAGRIPKRQRLFDETMDPPVIYRKEKDVLAEGRKMLNRYDRLWMLRNPPPRRDQPTSWWQWW